MFLRKAINSSNLFSRFSVAAFDGEQGRPYCLHMFPLNCTYFSTSMAPCSASTKRWICFLAASGKTIYFPAFARCPHLFKPGHALRTVGIIRPPSATDSEIRSAYRRRALSTHPDKGGSPEAFRAVVFAFETLILGSNGESEAWQLLVYHNILSTRKHSSSFHGGVSSLCTLARGRLSNKFGPGLGWAWAEVCIEYDMRHYEAYFIFVCQSLRCVYIQLCIKIFVPTS